ncbi:Ribonuclease Y [Labeo rohita]|uniref:Ribonuclease Y n=1 Tax=Labeo rohita TaxID=84645 RepID=A0ABQ8LY79_LABRO|nr:Ribonuclease Y [Labeo rohita]
MPFDKRKERSDIIDASMDVHDYASPAVNEFDLCVQDLKKNVKDVDSRLKDQERLTSTWGMRISDLERYSRRWNLRLFGVPKTFKEDIRSKVIRICSETYPKAKNKYPDVVDTVHQLGRRAAKKSQFLKDNNLRFAEDLTALDRERRKSLWPKVREARAAGKTAYHIGVRAFIEGAEITS